MNIASGRSRLTVALLIVVTVLSSLFVATEADARPTQRARQARDAQVQPKVEPLRLACDIDIVGDERGVLCRWSASSRDNLRGYQLYRIVNGSPRELVATVLPGERLHAFDTNVNQGDRLIYGVVARNGQGRVIGLGGPVRLGIPG